MAEINEHFTVVNESGFDSEEQQRHVVECQQTKTRGLETADPNECSSYLSDNVYITPNGLSTVEPLQVANVYAENCSSKEPQIVNVSHTVSSSGDIPVEIVSIAVTEADPHITPFSPNTPISPIPPPTPATQSEKDNGFRYSWDDSAFDPVLPVRCKNTSGYLHKTRFGSG